jgi:hypothetical protein
MVMAILMDGKKEIPGSMFIRQHNRRTAFIGALNVEANIFDSGIYTHV